MTNTSASALTRVEQRQPHTLRILLLARSTAGGLAEHSLYQARALDKLGAEVTVLTSPAFLQGRELPFPCRRVLSDQPVTQSSRMTKRLRAGLFLLRHQYAMAWYVAKIRPDLVLIDCYAEYLSPLWVWPHALLARVFGITYAANNHDPVRNFRIGPVWWHKLSVRLAYLPLKFVLVHNKLPEPSPVPARVQVRQVPVGVYDLPDASVDRQEMRRRWGIQPDQKIFLSFGYVRDGKNLDLAIRALRSVPEAFLVVAGAVASTNDKPFDYYRELALSEGVEGRVKFYEGFVSNEGLADYFAAADFVLLTYSSSFHSQSGVLNIAVRGRLPVLASAAPSPLIESVKRFNLGVAIQPDSIEAIAHGMHQLLNKELQPCWEDYEAFADWDANARGILEAAGLRLPTVIEERSKLTQTVRNARTFV